MHDPPSLGALLARIEERVANASDQPERAADLLRGALTDIRAARMLGDPFADADRQVAALSDIIVSLARHEFVTEAPLEEFDGPFEVLRYGLTFLGEELEHTAVSRQQLESIVRSMSDMLTVTDVKLTLRRINPAFTSAVALKEEELLGLSLAKFLNEEVVRALASGLEERREPLFAGDSSLLTPNGEAIPVHLSASIVFDEHGDASGVVCVAQDIRERTRIQNELKAHRENLAGLVRERTSELERAQGQLLRRERLAVLGQLTASVAHELRNPLGTLRSSMFVINHIIGEEPRLAPAIARCLRSVSRCDRIIEELLDFTRIRAPLRERLQLNEWLARVVEDLEVPDGIEVALTLSSDDSSVSADAEQLRRALINIVNNACDAMCGDERPHTTLAASARLSITTRRGDDRIEIIVTDNGEGMSPETAEQVFEPLFSTRGFGVGLGMAIVQRVLAAHHGGVAIDSALGRGTTVTLWIPSPPA